MTNYDSIISILMPARNSSEFIRKTIDSIISQTEKNWELLIVNDGSTDNTDQILKIYAENDDRIRIFDNEQGSGIIPALQTAFEKSRGELITRMDSDDLMAPHKLETMRKLLKANGPGHVATGMVECFSDDGIENGYRKYEKWLNGVITSVDPYSEIYRECVIPSSCWMVYREDLVKCGAFEPEIYPEDYDLCFRMYCNGLKPVVNAEAQILHYWRDHPGRVSRNNPEYADQQFFDLKLKYFFAEDRDSKRDLVIWGTGKKGKKLVRKILDQYTSDIIWITDNPKKIGEKIYGIEIENADKASLECNKQIIIAVSGPEDRRKIEKLFINSLSVKNGNHFFFC